VAGELKSVLGHPPWRKWYSRYQ